MAASLAAASFAAPAWGQDAAGASREDTLSLQRRLTDAGCYAGALDGAPSAALDSALAECPDLRPTLRIETGMHNAQINHVAVDASCSRLATSSLDKTLRIWSLPSGRLERTIRLPIGAGSEGMIYATALSPDGTWLASGGWDAAYSKTNAVSLTLFDLRTGAIRRMGQFENVIANLAFSPDGRRIAVGLGGNAGLRVLDVDSGAEQLADRGFGDTIDGLAFGPDGSLFAASGDGFLRRYAPDLRLMVKRAPANGAAPKSVAIDPKGRRLAVSYDSVPRVSILDPASLAPLAEADTRDLLGQNLAEIAWSADGEVLSAGGSVGTVVAGEPRRIIRRFAKDGRRLGPDARVTFDILSDIRACGGGFVFASQDPDFGLLGADGKAQILQGPRTVDMRGKRADAFALSADGTRVLFGLGYHEAKPATFDLLEPSLADSPKRAADLRIPTVVGLPVSEWADSMTPKFRGEPIALDPYEISHSLAIRSDRRGFALGTEWLVRAFDAAGKERWKSVGPGRAGGVNFTGDGDVLAVAYGDGTIRWLRWSDGHELLALFVEPQGRKWVAWTPTGYYMASPGGEDLIGWHVNRGWTQQADFFPASRFAERFNRPDVVKLILATRDEAKAVEQADAAAHRRTAAKPIEAQLPPVIQIISPTPGGRFLGDAIEIIYSIRAPSGLPVDGVRALVDGRPVETRGLAVAKPDGTQSLTIPAPAHDFELALIARSGDLVGEAAKVRLVYGGAPPDPAALLKPKLYAVAIGVGAYADENLRLTFPAADARGVAEALARQKGGLYSDVEVRTLVDGQAKRADVIDALDWLGREVTSRDIGIVLIAGHGVTDERGDYWFLPADAAPARLGATAISQADIRRELDAISGKAMLFLDTCHANSAVATRGLAPKGVDVASVVNDFSKTENGVVVFASSQGNELAREDPVWGHGAFSLALIDGLEGKADLLHTGEITVSGLDLYIAERVKELTGGRQHPVMSRPGTIPDFAFALAR